MKHLQTTTWDFLKLRGEGPLNTVSKQNYLIFHQCSLNFIRLLQVVITSSVTTLLRGENDSKQSDEIQAITSVTTKEMETKISTPDTSEGFVLTPRLAVLEWILGKCLRIIWIFPQNSFLKLWEFAMKKMFWLEGRTLKMFDRTACVTLCSRHWARAFKTFPNNVSKLSWSADNECQCHSKWRTDLRLFVNNFEPFYKTFRRLFCGEDYRKSWPVYQGIWKVLWPLIWRILALCSG